MRRPRLEAKVPPARVRRASPVRLAVVTIAPVELASGLRHWQRERTVRPAGGSGATTVRGPPDGGRSATSIAVVLPGSSIKHTTDVIGSDTAADIAVLKIRDTSGRTPAPLGRSGALRVGDEVVAIGNALALEGGPTVTNGVVSALGRSIDTDTGTLNGLIQTDAAISSGNSGGPLVNTSGQVVGINVAAAASSSTVEAENIGFAIPIDPALGIVQRLQR